MRRGRWILAVLALVGLATLPRLCRAVEHGSTPDKSGYSLFRPTPASLLRDLSTDRPDRTESPYTVDAGHAQLEIEAVGYSRDQSVEGHSDQVGLLGLNAKVGLLPFLDVQAVVGWAHATQKLIDGGTFEQTGVSDLTVRVKYNLWGNDAGPTALGLMPFVRFPTGSGGLSSDAVEGGLIVPLALSLPAETSLGAMVEVDAIADKDGSGDHAEWTTTTTVGHDLFGRMSGFLEIAATQRPASEGDWIGTFDAGLVYRATPNLQFDAGALVGNSEAADGASLFLGITVRR